MEHRRTGRTRQPEDFERRAHGIPERFRMAGRRDSMGRGAMGKPRLLGSLEQRDEELRSAPALPQRSHPAKGRLRDPSGIGGRTRRRRNRRVRRKESGLDTAIRQVLRIRRPQQIRQLRPLAGSPNGDHPSEPDKDVHFGHHPRRKPRRATSTSPTSWRQPSPPTSSPTPEHGRTSSTR